MKKKLESELMSIAHRILKLKGKEDVLKMHQEVGQLYEKLSVMKFAQDNFETQMPTIGVDSSFFDMLETAFNNKVTDAIEQDDQSFVNMDSDDQEDIIEPVMEKIKDIVAQMPHETHHVDSLVEAAITNPDPQLDFDSITADFMNMPIFEPLPQTNGKDAGKKSLNDRLKNNGLTIGLNDKLAFIKHLFDGESETYNRVLSQINTASNFDEVHNLIENLVKPDYNNWKGKEEFEERFMYIIESKFS